MGAYTRLFSTLSAVVCFGTLPLNNLSAATSLDIEPLASDSLSIMSIVQVDDLGFECIQEADIDAAFHLTGKGLRLPRTCQPNPCDAALSQLELGSLIGRAPNPGEWDDYYARYADVCVSEVTPFGLPEDLTPVFTAGDLDPFDVFWTPLVSSYGPAAPILARLGSSSRSSSLPPLRASTPGGLGSSISNGPGFLQTGGGGGGGGGGGETPTPPETVTTSAEPPAPIPVPATLLLLGAGLASLLAASKRRA